MSRRRAAYVSAALAMIVLGIIVGCGSFATGNSSSGGTSGGTSDGAILTPDDGGGGGPGLPDALSPPGDGAVCSPMASICNGPIQTIRFDNTSLPNDWDAGGPIGLQDEAFCAPRALRAEVTIPGFKSALATHRFGGGKISKAHLRYAMRGPAHKPGATLKFGCALYFMADNPDEQTSEFRFELEADGRLQIDGSTDGSAITHEGEGFVIQSTTTATDWRTVDIQLTVTSAKIDLIGTFDGQPLSIFLNTKVHPSVNEIRCGIEDAAGADGSYVVYIDDVQIQTCPLL